MKKKFISLNKDTDIESEVTEVNEVTEEKEEEEMGFFKAHKKGLIIGGLSALAAGAVALVIKGCKEDPLYDDEEDEIDDDFDQDSDTEASEE